MEFVGNYAPYGLSPQTDGMPVIQISGGSFGSAGYFNSFLLLTLLLSALISGP